ncbi:MAG: hypothetical protein DMG04_19840 [Acidobacteria bacterium]|nr:MAG: hypothetical protein DMG04_19840 [Acidobacteriota bacterium]
MRRAASLFVLLGAAALHAQPPPPPPPPPHDALQTRPLTGTGTIRGRVIADDGDEPLRKARVVIGGPTSIPPGFTDDQGRFAFTKLPAGQYALTARKAGYAAAAFGSRHPGEPPMRIDLAAGGTVDGVDVRIMRGAAISGRLVDEFGEAIENAAGVRWTGRCAITHVLSGRRRTGSRAANRRADRRGTFGSRLRRARRSRARAADAVVRRRQGQPDRRHFNAVIRRFRRRRRHDRDSIHGHEDFDPRRAGHVDGLRDRRSRRRHQQRDDRIRRRGDDNGADQRRADQRTGNRRWWTSPSGSGGRD